MPTHAPPGTEFQTGEPTPTQEMEAFLQALAPFPLANQRAARYMGDDVCAAFGEFALEDQQVLRRLYAFLVMFLDRLAPYPVAEEKWPQVEEIAASPETDGLLEAMQGLGDAARRGTGMRGSLAKAIHDLRGGGLASILGRLQLIAYLHDRPDKRDRPTGELNQLFILARDHLKITRNAITGLDDTMRDRDRASKFHHIDMVANKWQNALPGAATRNLPVRVNSRYHGNMSESCLESAAVDRIFYNLINNACRHCAGDGVHVDILLMPGEPHGHIRFIISNEVSAEHAIHLREMGGGGLEKLFHQGVSSTGSGLGLSIVAEFVGRAFGLAGKEEAVSGRYVGAVLRENRFSAWFHWPAAREAPPDSENNL